MGNAQSSETLDAKENTRQIEKQIKQDRKTSMTTIQILLFGGEESTRSALLEQVKALHPTANLGSGQSSVPEFVAENLDGLHPLEETMGPGVIETIFKGDELTYKLIDVGRQRSETMKWMPCFADVHAILFLVNWSEYDQVHVTDDEDGDPVNRLKESLALFDTVCNSQWFQNTSIIIVSTDTVAFTRKLRRVPLSDYFPDYTGGADFSAARHYLLKRFMALNHAPKDDREIYAASSSATGAAEMAKDLMKAVTVSIHSILKKSAINKAKYIF